MLLSQVIREYPKVFGHFEDSHIEEHATAIVAGAVSRGSDQQKEHFRLRDTYTAVCKLIDLGFRKYAAPLGEQLFEDLLRMQWYSQAYDIASNLMLHHYLVGSMHDAQYYEDYLPKLSMVLQIENQCKAKYLRAVSLDSTGQDIDLPSVLSLIEDLKEKLPMDSVWYHYYYYMLKALVSDGDQVVQIYEEAINYYESLYFDHSAMKSIFIKRLIEHYKAKGELVTAVSMLGKLMLQSVEGSTSWFRYMMLAAELQRDQGDYKAALAKCNEAMQHTNYSAQPEDRHIEWQALVEQVRILSAKGPVPVGEEDDAL